MAILVLTNAKVVVNTVDLSDHCRQVSIEMAADTVDATAMGATWKANKASLKSATFSIEFNQDYASGSVDGTLFAALGTSVAITGKPVNTTTSTTNPEYQFNGIINKYEGFGQKVGELDIATVSGVVDGAITRATS